jgi:Flp pilus assembly pilin Flp
MDTLEELMVAFHNDEDGATATEYIILLILIACFVIVIVKTFGETVSEKFNSANQGVQDMVEFD